MPPARRSFRFRWILVTLGVLGLLWFIGISDPERTTHTYLAIDRAWYTTLKDYRGSDALRRIDPLMQRLGLLRPVRIELEPHVSFVINPSELVERQIYRNRYWEPEVWKGISSALREGAVFFDIGAHVGYYSLKSARVVGPSGRVVSFEPNPRTVKMLEANIRMSNAVNITVEPIACTDREQTVDLYSGAADNTGTASLSKENAQAFNAKTTPYRVRGRPIDDVVRELDITRLDCMKLDVEGAETMVLRGSLETLKRFHPVLVTEVIERQLKSMGSSEHELRELLTRAGYKGRQITPSDYLWTHE